MLARLLTGILTCVFVPLGAVFLVLGLVEVEMRSGTPEGFVIMGASLLAVGLACLAAFLVLTRRERAARDRRRAGLRTAAEIVRADLQAGIRVGALLTYDLTVRFAAAGEVQRRLTVVPGTRLVPGETVDVLYDPADPANFEVAQ